MERERERERSRKGSDDRSFARMKKECATSFWKFASKILDGKATSHVDPKFLTKDAEDFFTRTYSSSPHIYTQPDWLASSTEPQQPFDCDPIRLDEVISVLKRARSSSSPCPIDGIVFKILKSCPSLASALLLLFNVCWEKSVVPAAWKQAVIKLLPKKNASDDPSNPANFRPIALTPCVGKIYTTIIKDRWLSYMKSNNYFDTRIQKAFMPSVPGCVEHYVKLATAVSEARSLHKSLCVCWLDLANAYGSVHHNLISFSLQHYHAPPRLSNMVNNFYCGLGASIQLPEGHTSTIPLQIGLYQGDPLSVTIFNTVMNTYLDGLKSFQTKGYKFSNSIHSLYVLQYADDTCLTSDGPASCRAMLEFTEQWLQWSGMKAKPCKCQCLAVEASTGRTYDPNLQIQGEKIQFIGKEPIRFLGGTIQVPNNPSLMRDNILAKLTTLLDRVDQTPITRKQKLKLYRLGICPRFSWDLTISEFPISWVEKTLDSLVTRYLKKWSGLAKPADPVRLFLPIDDGGLNLSLPSTLYQKLQVGKASLLIKSPDNVVSHTVKERIDKESQQQRAKFRPFTLAQQAYSANPGASGRAVSNRAKKMVGNEVKRKYLEHSMSLNTQGKLFELVDNNASSIWAKAPKPYPLLK